MTIRERLAQKKKYKTNLFTVRDPEQGIIPARVEEFEQIKDDSPVMEYEVVKVEIAHERK